MTIILRTLVVPTNEPATTLHSPNLSKASVAAGISYRSIVDGLRRPTDNSSPDTAWMANREHVFSEEGRETPPHTLFSTLH